MITLTVLSVLFTILCTIKVQKQKRYGQFSIDSGWYFAQLMSLALVISMAIVNILAYLP
jgi:hypothetical protein